jgi:hypothetical protein
MQMKLNTFNKERVLECVLELKDDVTYVDELVQGHELDRITATLSRIPPAKSQDNHIVDIGGTVLWVHLYSKLLNYKKISLVSGPNHLDGPMYGGKFDEARLKHDYGCNFIPANVDLEPYKIQTEVASCVVCFEVLEHLSGDPMHLIGEANRIINNEGCFYITTPNVLCDQNLVKYWLGGHPFFWSVYTDGYGDRHNREYTVFELIRLMEIGGFSVEMAETLTYDTDVNLVHRLSGVALSLIPAVIGRVPFRMRGQFSHIKGRRVAPIRERYPSFLYKMFGEERVVQRF